MQSQLIATVRRGGCVPFIGAGLSKPAGLPSASELSEYLGGHMGDNFSNEPLSKVAEAFEISEGPDELRRFLIREIHYRNPKPKENQRIIARLAKEGYFPKIFTTNWDTLIEDALKEVDCRWYAIERDSEISLAQESDVHVIKLHGSITNADELVVSGRDYRDFVHEREILETELSASLAKRMFLFLGYSLEDPNFDRVYHRITRSLGTLQRSSYAVQLKPSGWKKTRWRRHADVWKGRNITIIRRDVTEFLRELETRLEVRPRESSVSYALPSHLSDYHSGFSILEATIRQLSFPDLLVAEQNQRILILNGFAEHEKSSLLEEMRAWCEEMGVPHAWINLHQNSSLWTNYEGVFSLGGRSSLFEVIRGQIRNQFGDGPLPNYASTRQRFMYLLQEPREEYAGQVAGVQRAESEMRKLRAYKIERRLSESLITDFRALSHSKEFPFTIFIHAPPDPLDVSEEQQQRERIGSWLSSYVLNGIKRNEPGYNFVVVVSTDREFDFGDPDDDNQWRNVVRRLSGDRAVDPSAEGT